MTTYNYSTFIITSSLPYNYPTTTTVYLLPQPLLLLLIVLLFEGEAPAWSPDAAVALEEELRSNEINSMVRQLFGSPTEWTTTTEIYGVLGKCCS